MATFILVYIKTVLMYCFCYAFVAFVVRFFKGHVTRKLHQKHIEKAFLMHF